MKGKSKKVTKYDVSISFFMFFVLFLTVLKVDSKSYDLNNLSTFIYVVDFFIGILSVLFVSLLGGNFVFKLLTYYEQSREGKS